jgi:hypothetical protein
MHRPPVLSLLVLLALFGHGPSLAADSGFGRFAIEVRDKGATERCLKLAAGQSIRYRFSATNPVDFNIHYHFGDEVRQPIERKAIHALDGVFRAESTQDYCLMWERREAGGVRINGRIEPRRAAARSP